MMNKEIKDLIIKECKNNSFIIPNSDKFGDYNIEDVFNTILCMVKNKELKRRECDGLAYELNI